jgi:hypothetical protein
MPMIGSSNSSPTQPMAAKSERCGALSIPFFILSERMASPFFREMSGAGGPAADSLDYTTK